MAFCSNCGNELVPGAKFCSECGTPIDTENWVNSQRKEVYEGIIHKCPNCGEKVDAFVYKCPSCGYEFRGTKNSYAIHEFAIKLENAKTTHEKASIIRNYPIPNTKEDIYEFLILASSNIGNESDDVLIDAWTAKTEQAFEKAKIVFNDLKEFERIQELYKHVKGNLDKVQRARTVKNTRAQLSDIAPSLPAAIIIFGWLLSILIIMPMCRVDVDNVGTNGFTLLILVDLIAGAVFVPYLLRSSAILPKLIFSEGFILSIVMLIPLCNEHLDNVGTNAFQLILIVDIVCGIIIFVRMFKSKQKLDSSENPSVGLILRISIVCIAIWSVTYGISYITHPYSERSSSSSYTYKDEDDIETIVWDELVLGENLPPFGSDQAEVIWDTENVLIMYFYDMDNTIYKSYIEECQEFGYTIDAENSGANYTAYNSDGYYLHLQYLDFADNKLTIDLEDPIKQNVISWPDSDLLDDVPVPEKLIGEVSTENSEAYAVYLTGMAPSYFETYVAQCKKSGFSVDYSKSDDYYSADHKDGRSITVEYRGFNILYIYVENYDW